MFVIMFATLGAIERVVGDLGLAASMVVVLIIAFAYPIVVRALGVEPQVWKE